MSTNFGRRFLGQVSWNLFLSRNRELPQSEQSLPAYEKMRHNKNRHLRKGLRYRKTHRQVLLSVQDEPKWGEVEDQESEPLWS